MRTGRPKQPLILTEEEQTQLQPLAHRARSQPLLARRARVVLACAEGLDNQSVAKKLRVSLGMVGKWRSRFLKARLEGLSDEPRPGAPRWQNNRAENSHQPTRIRERVMRRFKSSGHAQRFLSAFGIISSHFRVGRYLYRASGYRAVMKSRLAVWERAICVEAIIN